MVCAAVAVFVIQQGTSCTWGDQSSGCGVCIPSLMHHMQPSGGLERSRCMSRCHHCSLPSPAVPGIRKDGCSAPFQPVRAAEGQPYTAASLSWQARLEWTEHTVDCALFLFLQLNRALHACQEGKTVSASKARHCQQVGANARDTAINSEEGPATSPACWTTCAALTLTQ